MNTSYLKLTGIAAILAVVALGSVYLFARPPAPQSGGTTIPATTSAGTASPLPTPAKASGRTIIAWTPTSVSEILSPGESKTVSVNFISSKNIRRVAVEVSKELQSMVQVQPQSLEKVRKGKSQTIMLILAPTANQALGTVTGTIQLRKSQKDKDDPDEGEEEPGKLLPPPLSVTVNVWNSIASGLGFVLHYPPPFVPVESTGPTNAGVGFYSDAQSLSEGVSPTFIVTMSHLADGISLIGWIKSFGVDEADIEPITLGGRQFLKWSEPTGQDFATISYSTSAVAGTVITVTAVSPDFGETHNFSLVVSSLTLQ